MTTPKLAGHRRALDGDRKVSGNVMLKFQWNALRRGDRVLVHDSSDVDLRLRRGVVTLIDVLPSGHDVSIRLATGATKARVVRPGRFAVHLEPVDADDDGCWRCSDIRQRTQDNGLSQRGLGFSRKAG